MTGNEHYKQAEDCLSASECQGSLEHAARELAAAQVHATLALAAAVAEQTRPGQCLEHDKHGNRCRLVAGHQPPQHRIDGSFTS